MLFSNRKKSFEKHEKSYQHHLEHAISNLEQAKQYLVWFKGAISNDTDIWSIDTSIASINDRIRLLKNATQTYDCTDLIGDMNANLAVVFQEGQKWDGGAINHLITALTSLHDATSHINNMELLQTKIAAKVEW